MAQTADDWLFSAFPSCSAPAPRLAAGFPLPVEHRMVTLTTAAYGLGFHPVSVRTARDFALTTLRDWGAHQITEDIRLVVSELVSNAIQHAAPPTVDRGFAQPIQLCLLKRPSHVACMVIDPSPCPPMPPAFLPVSERENGRGLYLVQSFSTDWGYRVLDGRGKIVWAVLATGTGRD